MLERLGFAPGVIDGKAGVSTRNAVAGFQEASGLPRTGELDEKTRAALVRWTPFLPLGWLRYPKTLHAALLRLCRKSRNSRRSCLRLAMKRWTKSWPSDSTRQWRCEMTLALHTVRTIAVTVVVTLAGWVTAGALWLNQHLASQGGRAPPAPLAVTPPVGAGVAPLVGRVAETPAAAATGTVPVASEVALTIPVKGVVPAQLVDTFTQSRENGLRSHDAIDIPAPRGTLVVAAAAGRVEKLFQSKPGGQTIYVRSPDGTLLYYYAHLDGYAEGLAEGQAVAAGQELGIVGSTGNADPAAPHLHFAILQTELQARWWEPTTAINPYPLRVRP